MVSPCKYLRYAPPVNATISINSFILKFSIYARSHHGKVYIFHKCLAICLALRFFLFVVCPVCSVIFNKIQRNSVLLNVYRLIENIVPTSAPAILFNVTSRGDVHVSIR